MSRGQTCPKCGRKEVNYRGLCKSCFLNTTSIRTRSGGLPRITFCPKCDSVACAGEWKSVDYWEPSRDVHPALIEAFLSENTFIGPVSLKVKDLVVEGAPPGRPRRYYGSFSIVLTYEPDQTIEFDEPFEIAFSWATCPNCAKMSSGIFEAKIQLRGKDLDVEGVGEWIAQLLHSFEKESPIIAGIEGVKEGADVRFFRRHDAMRAMDAFQNRGALIKTTFESAGFDKQRQKPRKRTVISVRLWPFPPGTLLLLRGIPIQILSDPARKILYHDYNSGKDIESSSSDLWKAIEEKNFSILADKEEAWRDFQITSFEPDNRTALLMNMRTFETFYEEIERIPPNLDVGETFRGLIWEDRLLSDFIAPNLSNSTDL